MYKEKKKNIIESYGTIKLKKYNNQNQIYFYPNFNVNKEDIENFWNEIKILEKKFSSNNKNSVSISIISTAR